MGRLFQKLNNADAADQRSARWRVVSLALVLPLVSLALTMAGIGALKGDFPTVSALDTATRQATAMPGEFVVAVYMDGSWREIGRLPYNYVIQERTLALDGLQMTGRIDVRVEHTGTTLAHIDAVRVDDQGPLAVAGAAEDEDLAMRKLGTRDFDLVDAGGRTLFITFNVPKAAETLSLAARIQPHSVPKTPFQFPLDNVYQTIGPGSAFYTYTWDSERGGLAVDGSLAGEALGNPFFSAFCEPGTGHPAGFTHGWVRNDTEHLYVALDFTPDNTMDGDDDYAKVYVKTPTGVEAFKVSVAETRWGLPGFTYTEQVDYQHKVYEFAIPVSAFEDALDGDTPLALAFGAYGTVSPVPEPYPGPTDPSFAGDGVVTKSIGSIDRGHDLVIQSSGKIVVGGSCGDFWHRDFCMARFDEDGNLDPGFGSGGVVTTAVGTNATGEALALAPDGQGIILAGTSEHAGDSVFTLARYDADGVLDGGFGIGGVTTRSIGSGDAACHGLAVQNDGKLVAVGMSESGGDGVLTLARFGAAGAPDFPFGNGGVVTTPIGSHEAAAYDVTIQPDGKILVVGYSVISRGPTFAMARYRPGGAPDPDFGVSGIVTTVLASDRSEARAVAWRDDSILVAGYGHSGITDDFIVARYDAADGTLDTEFGVGGVVVTDFGSEDYAYDMAVGKDGSFVLAGENYGYRVAVARYLADGELDATFGLKGGRVNTTIAPAGGDSGSAVAIQEDGRIVVVGSADDGRAGKDFAVLRYARDLSLEKTVVTSEVRSGRMMHYRLAFHNSGAAAGNVQIVDHLPAAVTVVGIASSGVPITMVQAGPPTFRWALGKLGYGEGGVITITGRAPLVHTAATFTNTAWIQTPDWDSLQENNSDVAEATVVPMHVYLPVVMKQ